MKQIREPNNNLLELNLDLMTWQIYQLQYTKHFSFNAFWTATILIVGPVHFYFYMKYFKGKKERVEKERKHC